jgi:branched-chain amino acid transport system permease protein
VMFLLVFVHLRARPGRAWAAIKQSEPSALAAGINTTFYKLWALALSAFVTGVAGALLAGADRYLYSIDFPVQNSISLLAVTLMGGVFVLAGAVVAAFLQAFLPALLYQLWGVPNDWLIILFGVGVMQVLTTAPGGIAQQFPRDMRNLGRLIMRLVRRPSGAHAAGATAAAPSAPAAKGGNRA